MDLIQYTAQFSLDIIHGQEAKQRIQEIKDNVSGISEFRKEELNAKVDEDNKLKTGLKPFKMEGIKLKKVGSVLTSGNAKPSVGRFIYKPSRGRR